MGAPDQSHFYEPLQFKSAIRLLRRVGGSDNDGTLRFTLEQYSLDSHPPYVAISYTWGAPYFSKQDENDHASDTEYSALIQISGSTFYATRNMLEALQCASNNSKPQHIWVDAACIDQSSMSERSVQVRQMNRIYSQAEEVIVWLGSEHVHAESFQWMTNTFAFNVENAIEVNGQQQIFSMPPHVIAAHTECSIDDFTRLEDEAHRYYNACRWFERTWVVQEIYLARRLRMFCGELSMNPDGLALLQKHYTHTSWNTHRQSSLAPEPSSRALAFASFGRWITLARWLREKGKDEASRWFRENQLNPVYRTSQQPPTAESMIWLWHTIKTLQPSTCSDPRDKVYAALSLAESTGPSCPAQAEQQQSHLLQPDYTLSTSQLYTNLTKQLIRATGSLACLAEAGEHEYRSSPTHHHNDLRIPNLPSWVEDLSTKYTPPLTPFFIHSPFPNLVNALNLPTGIKFSATTLSAYGARFATVKARSVTRVEDRDNEVLSLIELIAFHAPAQVDGVPRLEALWRTLLCDAVLQPSAAGVGGGGGSSDEGQSNILTPAPHQLAEQFEGWVIYHLMTWLLNQIDNGGGRGLATTDAVRRLNIALSKVTAAAEEDKRREEKHDEAGNLPLAPLTMRIIKFAARLAMDFPKEMQGNFVELYFNVRKCMPSLFWLDDNNEHDDPFVAKSKESEEEKGLLGDRKSGAARKQQLRAHWSIDLELAKIGFAHSAFQSARVAMGAAERCCFVAAGADGNDEGGAGGGVGGRAIGEETFIGNGPRGLREGDQIWFVENCLMPIALRPLSEGVYTLVGGVYLHGFMRDSDEGGRGRMFEERYGLVGRWGRFVLA